MRNSVHKFLASFLLVTFIFPLFEPILAQEINTGDVGTVVANQTELETEIVGIRQEDGIQRSDSYEVSPPKVQYTPLVAILVEKKLYRNSEIRSRISRYGKDIQDTLELQSLVIPIDSDVSPRDIYELLSNLYFGGKGGDGLSQLKGVVIVGDLPIPVVEKGDVYLPTIFPYVDYIDPVYTWNEKSQRFIYEGTYEAKPEVWHGLIQSSFKDSKKAIDQLIAFFDQNHRAHIGDTKFSKKVFSANFDRQQTMIVDELFYKYTQWMKYVEPIQYLRFTKHFYRQLFKDEIDEGITDGFDSYPEDVQSELLEAQAIVHPSYTRDELIDAIDLNYDRTFPDLHSPKIIENLTKQYFETYSHWFDTIFFEIVKAARWDSENIETTPILVTRKDEDSTLRLRYFNDVLEDKFIELVKKHSVDSDVTISTTQTTSYQLPWCATISHTEPLYWNGVNRQGQPLSWLPPLEGDPLQEEIPSAETRPFNVEDCSRVRGSVRSEQNPFAQMVEGNKAFNFTAGASCLPSDTPISVRKDDKYEGSCIVNQEEKDDVLTYNYGSTTSQWLVSPYLHRKVRDLFCTGNDDWQSDNEFITKCFDLSDQNGRELDCCDDDNCDINSSDNVYCPFQLGNPECLNLIDPIHHYGAERSVFDIAGTEEVKTTESGKRTDYYASEYGPEAENDGDDKTGDGYYKFTSQTQRDYNLKTTQGVEACRPLVTSDAWGQGSTGFSSLMIHDEPRPETIWEQFKTQVTRALPVDDPRGFSFWDHQRVFHRVDFLNVFKFRGLFTNETDFKTAIENAVKFKINQINEISQKSGVATDLEFSEFENLLAGIHFEKLFGAIDWLEKNVEEKNKIVFKKAFSEVPEYQDYFIAPDAEGYEVVDIRGHGSHEKGLRMAFSPTELDVDDEYFDAWQKVLDFEYDNEDDSENLFNGVDIADTFFSAGKQESKCGSKPAGITGWAAMLGCSAGVFTEGTTKKMFIKGLGTKNPSKAIIEDFDVNLDNKVLAISPEEIYAYNQNVNLQEVVVKIKDKTGRLVEEDFSTRVKLNFSSSSVSRFYKITPAQEIPVSAGEAHFFLIPQASEFGGKIKMQATAFREDKPENKIKSEVVPVFVGRYGILGIPEKRKMTVKDSEGSLIKAKILDSKGILSYDMDGKVLEFYTDGGVFAGGINSVKIREGRAVLRFLPGRKSGEYDIWIRDPNKKIADQKVTVILEPDVPEVISLSKKSRYLVDNADPLDVTATLLDAYGNKVDNIFHQWTWQWENLRVSNVVERDIDPRLEGLQEFSDSSGTSTISIQPENGVRTARLSIFSDYFGEGKRGRSFNFQVVENPIITLELDKKKVKAGSNDTIKATAYLEFENGSRFKENYEADLIVNPLKKGDYPNKVQFKEGRATFEFTPGDKAGIYDMFLIISGFENAHTQFEVQADRAAKIEISRVGNSRYAAEIDKDKPIEILVQVYDKYKNLVPKFTESINLRATKLSKNLVRIPSGGQKFKDGQAVMEIFPQGISGKLRLIAEHNRLVGDVLEIDLADFFGIADVKDLAPTSLMAFILGFEAGDMRDRENFANQFLFGGNTQSVGTLISDPEPQHQYANISPKGDIKGETEQIFLFGNKPRFLISDSYDDLTENEIFFKRAPKVYLSKAKNNRPGIYFDINEAFLDEVDLRNNKLSFDVDPLLEVTVLGGVIPKDSNLELLPTDNIYQWEIEYEGDVFGNIIFVPEVYGMKTVKALNYEDDFAGVKVKSIAENIFFDRVFVGKNTRDVQGVGIFDKYKEASNSQKLGFNRMSEQQALYQDNLMWDLNWKPGIFFAAGNSIGDSVQWGSSDGFILLGDPSIKLKDKNPPKAYGFTQDIGKNFWQIPDGNIQQIIPTDINHDGNKDILVLSENKLFAQYQTDEKRTRFKDVGQILEFQDGVKSLATISTGDPKYPDYHHLVQINSRHQFILWENKNGVFVRQPIVVDIPGSIIEIRSARLNNDNFTDLIVVDGNRNLWALYSNGTSFEKAVSIATMSPRFEETNEVFEYGRSSNVYINLKFAQFGFKNITTLDSIDRTIWNTYTRPGDGILTTNPGEIAQYVEDSYLYPEKLTDFQNTFVPTEYASFLRKVSFSTKVKGGKPETLKEGDIIEYEMRITPDQNLENFNFMPTDVDQYEFVEDSFSCKGCVTTPKILDWHRGDGLLWAEVEGVSKRGKEMVFSWRQKVKYLPDFTFFVGDFDKKDNIDDISMPWFEDEKYKLLRFLSDENRDKDKRSKKSSPYKKEPKVIEFKALKSSFDDIKDLTQEELTEQADYLIGESSDWDGDLLPYGFDLYPNVHNDSADKIRVLQGYIDAVKDLEGATASIWDIFVSRVLARGTPSGSRFTGPGYAGMVSNSTTGGFGGRAVELQPTHGGGSSCDEKGCGGTGKSQKESDVGMCLPGWINFRQRPDPFGCDAASASEATGKNIKQSPGKCVICTLSYRKYVCPTSTGKLVVADAFRLQPTDSKPKWGQCLKNKANFFADKYKPDKNTWVSTLPQIFKAVNVDPSKIKEYQPSSKQASAYGSQHQTGSFGVLGVSGAGSGAAANSLTSSGKANFNAQLKPINKLGAQLNSQYTHLNRLVTESMSRSASGGMMPNPDFASQTAAATGNAQGAIEQAQNDLNSSIFNMQREPVPIQIPSTTPEELAKDKEKFENNREVLETELDEKIPPETRDFKERLDKVLIALKLLQKIHTEKSELPSRIKLEGRLNLYEQDFIRFVDEVKNYCEEENAKDSVCRKSKSFIKDAQDRIIEAKKFIRQNYDRLGFLWEGIQNSIQEIFPKLPDLIEKLEAYNTSLEAVLSARERTQEHVTDFEKNFEALKEIMGEGAEQIIQLRELENQIMSATAKMAEQYKNYHQGWMAEQQNRENQWASQQAANKQTLKSMQSVPDIYNKFADKCRTHNADKGTLFQNLTNEFIGPQSQPVTELPENPSLSQDGRFQSPTKMDIKLPTPQITKIEYPSNDTMNESPDVPDYADSVNEGISAISISENLGDLVQDFDKQVSDWNNVYDWTGKYTRFFPTLGIDGSFTKPENKQVLIPELDSELPEDVDFSSLRNMNVEDIPVPIEEQEYELPEVLPIPQLPKADFKPQMPQMPMDQLPITPPAPKMDNLTQKLMDNLKAPLKSMNEECKVRLGATSVPEWYTKPHGERRTTRSTPSLAKDYDPNTLKQQPFNDLAPVTQLLGATGRTQDITKGMLDNLKNVSKLKDKAFQQITNSLSEDIKKGLPRSIPWTVGQNIQASIFMTPELQAWIDKMNEPVTEKIKPKDFIRQIKKIAIKAPSTVSIHEDLKKLYAQFRLPKPRKDVKNRKLVAQKFEKSIAWINEAKNQQWSDTQKMKVVFEKDPIYFFQNKLVQNILEKDKRYFAAAGDDLKSTDINAGGMNFYQPENAYKKLQSYLVKYIDGVNGGSSLPPIPSVSIGAGNGPNGTLPQETVDVAELLDDGIYYALKEDDIPMRINLLPQYSDIVFALTDLDGDGEKEILYAENDKLYIKRKKDEPGQKLRYNLETWDGDQYKDFFVSVKSLETTAQVDATYLEFLPTENSGNYFSWELSERPDSIFEAYKKRSEKAANFQKKIGILLQDNFKNGKKQKMLARIIEVKGSPVIKSPIYSPVRFSNKATCRQLEVIKPDIIEGVVMAPFKSATFELYHSRTYEREAYYETINLEVGESMYLEDTEICLYKGELLFSEPDEENYLGWNDIENLSVVIPNSSIRLLNGQKLMIEFYDGTREYLEGPMEYELKAKIRDEDLNIQLEKIGKSQAYGIFSNKKGLLESGYRNHFLPITLEL